jgi:transcriptional regulator with XRE-family HTH domain
MSYDLGHSRGYVNNISSGKTLPSMTEFFSICDYFGITPIEFFDEKNKNPSLLTNAINILSTLSEDDLKLTIQIIRRLLQDE